jgi:2-polyprenyl-3-methyl-5-hydroxy-6-metoxy-1,4-benzoquinol methylase
MEQKPTGYYDLINDDLLNSIPLDAGVVVEVGCGTGSLGAEYKKRNADCVYYGIEIDAVSARVATDRLDKVYCASVDTVDLSDLAGRIDCLVYGDVLEHLIDPWAILGRHCALLKAGGKVVACIPNVQHWSLLEHLLQGNWVYHDHGILDNTHLRFFTLNSIFSLFLGVGLRIDQVIGLKINQNSAEAFFQRIRPALAGLGIDEDAFLQRIGALQYLVVASRE